MLGSGRGIWLVACQTVFSVFIQLLVDESLSCDTILLEYMKSIN